MEPNLAVQVDSGGPGRRQSEPSELRMSLPAKEADLITTYLNGALELGYILVSEALGIPVPLLGFVCVASQVAVIVVQAARPTGWSRCLSVARFPVVVAVSIVNTFQRLVNPERIYSEVVWWSPLLVLSILLWGFSQQSPEETEGQTDGQDSTGLVVFNALSGRKALAVVLAFGLVSAWLNVFPMLKYDDNSFHLLGVQAYWTVALRHATSIGGWAYVLAHFAVLWCNCTDRCASS
mgnify:CR=1 FL=1